MRLFVIGIVVVLGVSNQGCGESSSPAAESAATADSAQAATPPDGPIDIEACQLLDSSAVAEATGARNLKAEQEAEPGGAFQCEYVAVTGTVAVVNTHHSDAKSFDEFKDMVGAEAETVTGIGDGAYLWNANRIYVRVGSRGFSIGMQQDMGPKRREALLDLARRGVEKMRSLPPR